MSASVGYPIEKASAAFLSARNTADVSARSKSRLLIRGETDAGGLPGLRQQAADLQAVVQGGIAGAQLPRPHLPGEGAEFRLHTVLHRGMEPLLCAVVPAQGHRAAEVGRRVLDQTALRALDQIPGGGGTVLGGDAGGLEGGIFQQQDAADVNAALQIGVVGEKTFCRNYLAEL